MSCSACLPRLPNTRNSLADSAPLVPKKLVTEIVQPAFDAIIVFLRELDISNTLATFLQKTENLKGELETELNRTADAYEDMTRAIPSDFRIHSVRLYPQV